MVQWELIIVINLLALLVLNEAHSWLWLQLFKHSLLAKIICNFWTLSHHVKLKMAIGESEKIPTSYLSLINLAVR